MASNNYLPYGRHNISEADIEAVVNVLRSPFLTQGPVVPEFEACLAHKVGSRYAVAANSATSALHLACLALGLGPGDRLWTTPISFVASANCGLYCGAKVDFVDIDQRTGLMSIESLENKLESAFLEGTLPKILVPVHLAGTSCDMSSIYKLSQRYGFRIIEDASHAIGGSFHGTMVGSCKYSDITVFSFHPVKIITTAEGGVATTNDMSIARRLQDLRSHGIVKDSSRFSSSPLGPWAYEQQLLGYNYRMTDIQAALGISQLERLEQIVTDRNNQLSRYHQLLDGLPLQLLTIPKGVLSSVHLAIIKLKGFSASSHSRIFTGLRECNIGVQLHYSPIHLQPYYQKLGFFIGQFPEAESYACSAISLPIFPGLSADEQLHVANTLAALL